MKGFSEDIEEAQSHDSERFENPFSEYNAKRMSIGQIIDYWCSPFSILKPKIGDEKRIFKEKQPMLFMGGRGSGKTMFLRYFSYEVQRDMMLRKMTNNPSEKSIIDQFKENGGLGLYLTMDSPSLETYKGCDIPDAQWNHIFIHDFELHVCKLYLDMISDLFSRGQLNKKFELKFIPRFSRMLGMKKEASTLEEIKAHIDEELDSVSNYRGRAPFSNEKFNRDRIFEAQYLTYGIPELIKSTIDEFRSDDFNFVLLIDEYENYSEEKQKYINTLIKFHRQGISFRVGMRLEGLHTRATINSSEFLKENRDYTSYVFDDIIDNQREYQRLLSKIARNRLRSVPLFKNHSDIVDILGKEENLEEEALELTKNGKETRHFSLLKVVPNIDVKGTQKVIENSKNPLLEMMNILWIIRGRNKEIVKKAMNDYLTKRKNDLSNKYKSDFINKYKLSLMFLLASQYRKRKRYYSFNTFSYLSSGIIGHFIELCRRSFEIAYYESREHLIIDGKINSSLQDRAAREMARTEIDMIIPIKDYGDRLNNFTKNLGHLFRLYHEDYLLSYPETNQFSIESIPPASSSKNIIEKAIEWSIIQKKSRLQQSSIGGKRDEVYTLSRIYSPNFDITYRTRGGIIERLTAADIEGMCKPTWKPETRLKKSREKSMRKHPESTRRGKHYDYVKDTVNLDHFF